MIRVTLDGMAEMPPVTFETTDVRISGGVIWQPLDQGAIASYTDGRWRHEQDCYPIVSIAGPCHLLFGIARGPDSISEPVELITIAGPIIKAAGVEFARYIADAEVWQGLQRPLWWRTMRIIGPTALSVLVDGPRVQIVNPWEPAASQPH